MRRRRRGDWRSLTLHALCVVESSINAICVGQSFTFLRTDVLLGNDGGALSTAVYGVFAEDDLAGLDDWGRSGGDSYS